MKSITPVLIFLFLPFLLQAQSKVQDPEAEPWLNKVSNLFSSTNTLMLTFGYTREDLQSKEEVNGEGTVYLKNDKYRAEFDGFIIYFDGVSQYSQNTDAEEVYISKPDPENQDLLFSDPVRLLKNYKENFKYRLMGETTFSNKKAMEIQLYPVDISGPYALIKLFMAYDSSTPLGIQVRQKEGILYTMRPVKVEKDMNKPDSFFRFNPEEYKDFDVIELAD